MTCINQHLYGNHEKQKNMKPLKCKLDFTFSTHVFVFVASK